VAAAVLVTALAAGCSGDPPVSLDVTTPAASATAGSAPPATAGRRPPPPAPVGTVPSGPQPAYQALVGDWQRSRSAFFAAVSSGESSTVATQRALAARFLAAERAFGAGLSRTAWPAAARPAVRALLDRIRGQQATIAAMAAAGSKGEFTARLADYGVAAGPENAAVTAVARGLH
jgi:hypothetical protein